MSGTDARLGVELAARIRDACVRAALEAYEDAGLRGLCGDGRWEYAVDALRRLDPRTLLKAAAREAPPDG